MYTEWSQTTKRTVMIGIVLIGVVVLYISRPVIPFVILAGILAFVLAPIINVFCKYLRAPRWLAVIVSYLLLLVAIITVPVILIPAAIDAIQSIDLDVESLLREMTAWATASLQNVRQVTVLHYELDLSTMVDPALETLTGVAPDGFLPTPNQIINSLPPALEIATGFASTVVGTVLSALIAFIFTFIYSIYLSFDMPLFKRSMQDFVPEAYRAEYTRLAGLVGEVWMAYFRGQLVLCLIVGVIVGLGTFILGVPGALILGILAGLLEVLPTIGPIMSAVPAVMLALIQGSSVLPVSNLVFAIIIILFYIVVQQFENNIIVPRVIGTAIEVHPVLVMAAVIVGASVAGIFGAFMASPVLATGRVLGQYVYNKLLGLPPFPEEEEVDRCAGKKPLAEKCDESGWLDRCWAYVSGVFRDRQASQD